MAESRKLVVGDYGLGAFGPTILLKLFSEQSVRWLRDTFLALRDGAITDIDLTSMPQIHIRGIAAFRLHRVAERPVPALRGPNTVTPNAQFDWELDPSGWAFVAALLDAFLTGQAGHQYLTDEGRDAVLVEVSYGEPRVHIEST